jgi:hypothetical protein
MLLQIGTYVVMYVLISSLNVVKLDPHKMSKSFMMI